MRKLGTWPSSICGGDGGALWENPELEAGGWVSGPLPSLLCVIFLCIFEEKEHFFSPFATELLNEYKIN